MDLRVDGEKSLFELDCWVFEGSISLIIKCMVVILTQIPLMLPIAAVPNYRFGTAARAIDAIAPANLRLDAPR